MKGDSSWSQSRYGKLRKSKPHQERGCLVWQHGLSPGWGTCCKEGGPGLSYWAVRYGECS
jgi:hypothetical protein